MGIPHWSQKICSGQSETLFCFCILNGKSHKLSIVWMYPVLSLGTVWIVDDSVKKKFNLYVSLHSCNECFRIKLRPGEKPKKLPEFRNLWLRKRRHDTSYFRFKNAHWSDCYQLHVQWCVLFRIDDIRIRIIFYQHSDDLFMIFWEEWFSKIITVLDEFQLKVKSSINISVEIYLLKMMIK